MSAWLRKSDSRNFISHTISTERKACFSLCLNDVTRSDISIGIKAKSPGIIQTRFPGFKLRIVSIDDCQPIFCKMFKKTAFFCGNPGKAAQTFKMGGTDIGDQANGRLCDVTKLGHFSLATDAHLKHGHLMRGFQAKQRKRKPDMIIQVAFSFQNTATPRQNCCNHFFCRRFTIAACHGNQWDIEAFAMPLCQILKGAKRVINQYKKPVFCVCIPGTLPCFKSHAGDNCTRSAECEALFDIVMSVEIRPGQGDKKVVVCDASAID